MPRFRLIITVLSCMMAAGCIPRPEYPDEPVVSLESMSPSQPIDWNDTVAMLHLTFTDGDGDVGLDEGDTIGDFAEGGPHYYNVLVFWRELQGGQYVQRPDTGAIRLHARIGRLTGNDGDGPLEGEMFIAARGFPSMGVDSLRYAVCLVDRSLHVSDTVVTPPMAYPF